MIKKSSATRGAASGKNFRAALLRGTALALLPFAALSGGPAMAQSAGELYPAWIGFSGEAGSRGFGGGADLWWPLVQSPGSVWFGFARGFGGNDRSDVDAGIGYRFVAAPDLVLGVNAGLGVGWSDAGTSAARLSLGLEAKGLRWDAHVTGYGARQRDKVLVAGTGGMPFGVPMIVVDGNSIGMMALLANGGGKFERAASGFEGEAGYRFDLVGAGQFSARLYGGGYGYFPSNGGVEGGKYRDIWGAKGGLEFQFGNVDLILPGSTISLRGEVRHDNQRGWDGYGTLRVAMPLGGKPAGDPLQRRLSEPVQRDRAAFGERKGGAPIMSPLEPVYTEFMGQAFTIQSIWFASASGSGSGTQANPSTLANALVNAGGGPSIVVVQGGAGSGLQSNAGFVMGTNQVLLGGGSALTLFGTGTLAGQSAVYNAPGSAGTLTGSGVNMVNPVLSAANNGQIIGVNVADGRIGVSFDGVSHVEMRGGTISNMTRLNDIVTPNPVVAIGIQFINGANDIGIFNTTITGISATTTTNPTIAQAFGIFADGASNVTLQGLNISNLTANASYVGSPRVAGGNGGAGGNGEPGPGPGEDAPVVALVYGMRLQNISGFTITDTVISNVQAISTATAGAGGDGGNGGTGTGGSNGQAGGTGGNGGNGGDGGKGGNSSAVAEAGGLYIDNSGLAGAHNIVLTNIQISGLTATATSQGGNGGNAGRGGDGGIGGDGGNGGNGPGGNGGVGGTGGVGGNGGQASSIGAAVGLTVVNVNGLTASDLAFSNFTATATSISGNSGLGGNGGNGGGGGTGAGFPNGATGNGGNGGTGGSAANGFTPIAFGSVSLIGVSIVNLSNASFNNISADNFTGTVNMTAARGGTGGQGGNGATGGNGGNGGDSGFVQAVRQFALFRFNGTSQAGTTIGTTSYGMRTSFFNSSFQLGGLGGSGGSPGGGNGSNSIVNGGIIINSLTDMLIIP